MIIAHEMYRKVMKARRQNSSHSSDKWYKTFGNECVTKLTSTITSVAIKQINIKISTNNCWLFS